MNSDKSNFQGKTFIVTGGASGLGLACVKRILRAGGNAVVADLNQPAAEAVAAELGASALGVGCDVSSSEQVNAMMARSIERFGAVDGIICCAGIGASHPFLELSEEDFDLDLRVNLKGTFLPSQAVARHLAETGRAGSIVAISSTQSMVCSETLVAYAAGKAGVIGLVRAMAVALGPYNIRVNAVAPGPMDTPMLRGSIPVGSETERLHISRTPLGRFADPDEMASAAVYFASDDASFITGQTLYVDGGRTVLAFVMPDKKQAG